MKKQDLVYEFFKYTAKCQRSFTLPSVEKGSGYLEVYSVSDLMVVDPSNVFLVRSGEEDAVKNQVRLMDAGFEILHPAVLLNLLLSRQMPERWKGKHIDFLGAWYCAKGWNGMDNNPMIISTFWCDCHWDVAYGRLDCKRGDWFTAITLR